MASLGLSQHWGHSVSASSLQMHAASPLLARPSVPWEGEGEGPGHRSSGPIWQAEQRRLESAEAGEDTRGTRSSQETLGGNEPEPYYEDTCQQSVRGETEVVPERKRPCACRDKCFLGRGLGSDLPVAS